VPALPAAAAPALAKPILFVELRFVWIFALVFCVHWALRRNAARKVWLLLASHAFYSCFFIGSPLAFFPKLWAARGPSSRLAGGFRGSSG